MTPSLIRSVRPAAALTAVLLVAGAVQVAPAAAAPGDPPVTALSLTSRAGYPPDVIGGGPGVTPDWPAYLGNLPATLSLVVDVVNTGTQPLHEISVATRVVTNGHVDAIRCSTEPRSPADPQREARQREPLRGTSRQRPGERRPSPPRPSQQRSSQGDAVRSWTDPTLVLAPGQTLSCSVDISGFEAVTVHEDITTATGVGVDTGTPVSHDAHVWAVADPPLPPPPPPISVGHLVWLDTDADGVQDEGEPGIPGVHLTIQGRDGRPPPDYETGQGVVGPQTTDGRGIYHFRHLKPHTPYTVTLDLSAPALAELMPARYPGVGWDPVHSIWSLKARALEHDLDGIDFGFKPKAPLRLGVDAPATAVAGTVIEVTGHADQPATGWWWDGPAVLEFRAGGTTTWTRVADPTSYRGKRVVKVTATRSGWFRFRSPGDVYTSSAVSHEAHVLVSTAPVALTAAAPGSVHPGTRLTVTGTITRAGTPFRTGRTTLEHSPDASTWTVVAHVRSTDGTLSATVQPTRTGSYRYRYAGDSRTAPGTSPARRVVVLDATVAR